MRARAAGHARAVGSRLAEIGGSAKHNMLLFLTTGDGNAGVGVFVQQEWIEKVVCVNGVNGWLMVLKMRVLGKGLLISS